MKRIAICDDNEIERLIIAEMLKEYCHGIQQQVELTEYSCGEQLIADIEEDECHVELICLGLMEWIQLKNSGSCTVILKSYF